MKASFHMKDCFLKKIIASSVNHRRDENYGKISRTKETIDQIGVPVEKGIEWGRFVG